MKSLFGAWAYNVVAKATGPVTVVEQDNGTLFTNRGASGSITFTLPKTQPALLGWTCEFFTVAAQSIVIATNPADGLAVQGDVAADTVTSAAAIGQHFRVICDGTSWLLQSDPGAASAATAVTAVTIAT